MPLCLPIRRWTAAAVLLVLGLFAARPEQAAAQAVDSVQIARFQLADSYFRAGQFDRSIALLEDLYAESPATHAFYEKLKDAYESVKRYDDAIALVEQKTGADPNPTLLSEKARLLYLKGDTAAAYRTWDEAVEAAPEREDAYRTVYTALTDVRLFDRAIQVVLRARERLDRPVFPSELAYLYSLTGQHREAMEEYLILLAENERQFSFVRSRLSRFMEQEEALRASIAATEDAVGAFPLNRPYRELLGWLYVEGGFFDRALDAYRAIDRLEREEGQVLYGFAQTAADAGAYDVALEAFQEVLRRYPDAPAAPTTLYSIGYLHERWADQLGEQAFDPLGAPTDAPHYEKALATYQDFLRTYPNHPFYPDVLRRIGRLQQDVFYQLAEAEATLGEVISRYPNTEAAHNAAYDLGRAAVTRGELEDARIRFARLEEQLRTGELAELARYELALIHFYQGSFESALSLAEVMDVNTSTDVANDAIELKVLLNENRGPDSLDAPLRAYAGAALLLRQRRPAAALDTLDALLARHGQHALADEARFRRAEALRQLGRHEEAYRAFAELPLTHPTSFLADRSLFEAAEIKEFTFQDVDAAIELYTRLLTEYPGSLLASDARQRIRHLRGDGA